MTQLASVYHTNNIKMDYGVCLDCKEVDFDEVLSCGGFSQEDLKWWLKTEEDLSKQLSSLVKSEKLLKFEAYLDDYQTLVEKYIPTELYCKNYVGFLDIFEMKYGDFS